MIPQTLSVRKALTAPQLDQFSVGRHTTLVTRHEACTVFKVAGHSEWAGVGAQEWIPAEFVVTEPVKTDSFVTLEVLARFPAKGWVKEDADPLFRDLADTLQA